MTRRFVLFDEKIELYQICALDQEKINLTSSALEKLAHKGWRNDRQVCSLQGSLHIHVEKPFYDLRRNLCYEVDFCTLQGDVEQRESYLKFRDRMLQNVGLINAPFAIVWRLWTSSMEILPSSAAPQGDSVFMASVMGCQVWGTRRS